MLVKVYCTNLSTEKGSSSNEIMLHRVLKITGSEGNFRGFKFTPALFALVFDMVHY